jgi:hypothetical protein
MRRSAYEIRAKALIGPSYLSDSVVVGTSGGESNALSNPNSMSARWPSPTQERAATVSSLTDASLAHLCCRPRRSGSVVQANAPVVCRACRSVHSHFYPTHCFAAHPELLRVFNQGTRPPASKAGPSGSVVAYAVQLIDPEAPSFDHVMHRIGTSTSPMDSPEHTRSSSRSICSHPW